MACLHFVTTLLVASLFRNCDACKSDECTYVQDREPMRFDVRSCNSAVFCLNVTSLQVRVTHVVFQAHTYKGSLTVSLDRSLRDGRFAQGSNVGLVSVLRDRDLARWYLNRTLIQGTSVWVSVMATAYGALDPVPGGCNMEFPLKNDPNLYLQGHGTHLSLLDFGYGNAGPGMKCGSYTAQQTVHYDVYQFFMNERDYSANHFHDVMENLMDSDYVQEKATHITSLSWNDFTQLKFPAYQGIGTVFVVIVTVDLGNRMTQASYVPMVSYSCVDVENGCTAEGEFESKIVLTVLAIVGLFIAFCGHRFFKSEMSFIGFLAILLTAYILLDRFSTWSFLVCLYVSLGAACVGGAIWLLVWVSVGTPMLSVLLSAFLLGYTVASIIFNASPLGLVSWLRLESNYQALFFVIVLLVIILSVFITRVVNVLACAVVGSFFVVLAADLCLHGAVKYVLLNTIWKSTTPYYVEAFCVLPVQMSDILLYVAWGLLATIGVTFHYFLERNKPPFPESPGRVCRRSRAGRGSRPSESETYPDEDDEHRPLLISNRRQSLFGATRNWRQQPVEEFNQSRENATEWWQMPADSVDQSAVPVVSNTNTPPPPYEEEDESCGRAA